ncbi:MAG TPA: hypothetical protein VKG79_09780, partial [Bryobacteraceae bacterium]|nr:hypothetical protein [Bryobacteraceae bacterium]
MPNQTSTVVLPFPVENEPWFSRSRLIALFWIGAVITVVVMACVGYVGWDAEVCWKAIQTARHDSDPYAQGIAAL